MVDKWLKRLKLLRISKLMIIVCLTLSVVFAGFTIYGNKVGNFVINVSKGEKYLRLTEHEDFSKQTSRLTVTGINDFVEITFDDGEFGVPDDISSGIGDKNDKNKGYIAYSFYLLNTMQTALSYTMGIDITGVSRGLDKAVRVMIIENDNSKWDSYIYSKKEETQEAQDILDSHTNYETKDFKSDTKVIEEVFTLNYQAHIKYTVVMWVEGWDEDCNDSIVGGSIKMAMNFTVNE